MKSLTVAAAALTAVEARNLVRMQAQPTVPAMFALDGFSPAPTAPPAPEHIAARAASSSSPVLYYNTGNTCGFVSGISSAPYYCINKGDYCALSTSESGIPGRIACCGISQCNFRTTCVGSADIYTNRACNQECQNNSYIVKCSSSQYPFCNTVSLAGGVIDYACGISDITTFQVLQTSYSGQTDPQSYTPYTVTGTSSSPIRSSTQTSSSTSSTTSSSGTATPTSNNDSNKSSTPVGAIVGGVVGGVGAIALIGIGILLFLRNKKKNNAQQTSPAPLMSQPQTGGAPPPQQQYAYPDGSNPAYSTSPSATGAYYPPQQGSPSPNNPYSQPSVSPMTSYAPGYGQPGYGQQPYQQAGSPPPMQQQYAAPGTGVGAGAAAGTTGPKDATPGAVHEAPTANTAGHRGEMQELE